MSDATETNRSATNALLASEFPDCDLQLRRGRHIDQSDSVLFSYLQDSCEQLEVFYRRFGCDLIYRNDGYYFLLPSGEKLRKKHLGENSMLVGQALALLYLEPNTAVVGGIIERDQLLAQLDGVVGTDALIRAFNPKRRRYDERVAQETVRKKVMVEVRRLASLGFVELLPDNNMRLRPALLRFAEPVRGLTAPAESLATLIASGEVAMRDELPETDWGQFDDADENEGDFPVEENDCETEDGANSEKYLDDEV